MKAGIVKHPYLGDVKASVLNNRQTLQLKTTKQHNSEWYKKYDKYKTYEWKYCLFPLQVKQQQDKQFNSPIPKKYPIQKIVYQGYYVTSLRDQILTRAKNNAKFSENQILYILYTAVCAWREWKQFCKNSGFQYYFTAISSCHLLFNQEGEIKLITPLSSPLEQPPIVYLAPENIPPNIETPTSWNKSIAFAIGLIGAQLITMKIAHPFYQYKGPQLKFLFEDYFKWLKFSENNVPKEVYNIILLMTDINPWIRLKFGEFQALLTPYHESILDGKQSNINQQKSRASLLEYLKSKKSKNTLL